MDRDAYLARNARQDEVLARVERDTRRLPAAGMLTSPDQAKLLTMLARLAGARTAVEIGTFTGYGAICIARGLPADGRLTIFEVSDEYAAIARRNLEAAGELDKVSFVIGPATEHLGGLGTVDLAYVDADKDGYPAYYDALVPKLRDPGGLLLLDNMLRGERVLDPQDESVRVTAELNERIARDDRVDSVLLGIRDGLTIVTPRAG
jgi:caffeoyl-CoA O-methyltransferase